MNLPIIFLIDDDPALLTAVEQDLRKRYGHQYRLLSACSGETALQSLNELKQQQEQVALLLADLEMPGMNGAQCLVEAQNLYPDSRKILLTPYEHAEEAIRQINQVGINYYLVKPWESAAEKLYPVADDLLRDWQETVQLPSMLVKNIMNTHVARIRHDASLHHAAEIVALSGVGDLMVVDENGRFVGVLSEGDILRAALPDFDDILEEGGTLYDAYQIFLRNGRELAHKPITPLVIHNPLTLHPDDHVAKAATVLIDRQIRRLPVVKDGRLLGTVSRANICQAVVGTLQQESYQ